MEGKTLALMTICLVIGAGISVGAGYSAWGLDTGSEENIAIKVNGVEPTVDTIRDGTYVIYRDIILVTKDKPSGLVEDFIDWILSAEGQAIVDEEGFVSITPQEYTASSLSGTIRVAGSTTVQPMMVKFVEAYQAKNRGVTIEVTGGGSGAGATGVINGTADIGMLSRDLKSSESALNKIEIAKDGVILAVDKASGITDLTVEEIAKIYNGEFTNWSQVGGNDLKIAPIIREDGSGTRETFDTKMSAALGIDVDNFAFNMQRYSTTNSTGAMLVLCKSNGGSIGYVNLGSISDL